MDDSYAGALDHYLSPARHDAVKTRWEEPATRALLDAAVSRLDPEGPLRVVDIGCGTGDGLMLLRSATAASRRMLGPRGLRYTGLDLNEDLLRAARELHRENGNIHFVRADVRSELPAEPAELYLSCGVPYSHLTVDELRSALDVLFAAARRNPRPVALIVDVLGRYSIEWTGRWHRQRWPYRMSFFHTEHAASSTEMTTYDGELLGELIRSAARRSGVRLGGIEIRDRSILVGRHTTTGEFTPGLRPFRQLVNELFDPNLDADYAQLTFDIELPAATPDPIAEYYAGFGTAWNGLIAAVAEIAAGAERAHDRSVLQPMLADGLRELETSTQRGLGVGHSLSALVYTQP